MFFSYFKGSKDGGMWWFGKNSNFHDLGFDSSKEDENYVKNAIQTLSLQFHLVLITEYFDESIILLKDFMCWDFNNVLYLKKNARAQPKTTITDDVREKIYKWHKVDKMLYEHFNKTFWEKVQAYGEERMRKDVIKLNRLNNEIKETCLEGGLVPNKLINDKSNKVYNPPGVIMTSFNLKASAKTNKTCINLVKSERGLTLDLLKIYSENLP